MVNYFDKNNPQNPHDAAFKAAMDDIRVAREFFETYLPEHVKKLINPETLAIHNTSFIDKELHPTASDVLYGVELNDKRKSEAYLYILVEAQTNPDKWLPFRMLDYIVKIITRHIDQRKAKRQKLEKLPLVFPIIFYNGKSNYNHPIDIPSLFEYPELAEHMLTKEFKFIELRAMDDQALLKHHWVGLLELFMKHAKVRDAQMLLESVLDLFIEPLLKQEANKYVSAMLAYLISVGEVSDIKGFLAYLKGKITTPYPQLEGDVMRIADQLRQQGIQQGIQQGEYFILKAQLEDKFGTISSRYQKYLENLPHEDLISLSKRLLRAETIDELFDGK